MNFKEGTRRLAFLLGVIGFLFGGFVSYLELQSVLDQRARHSRFEQLANSEIVQQERKILQTWKPVVDPKTGEPIRIDPKTEKRLPTEHGPWEKYATSEYLIHISAWDAQGIPITSRLDSRDVKTVHWTKDFGVESMETEDGQTLYPTPAPSRWLYVFVVFCPIFGFFIPWVLIRAIGWVGSGFYQSSM